MDAELPRIESVKAEKPSTLRIRWRGKRTGDVVDLTGWIATGGKTLAALKDAGTFARASVANYGAAVGWDDGDLGIDAFHLKQLADEQKPFSRDDIAAWQDLMRVSNNEAADLLHVALSTWNGYKSGAPIPAMVGMLCRAMLRDPVLMQAHYRPRVQGRPRTRAASSTAG